MRKIAGRGEGRTNPLNLLDGAGTKEGIGVGYTGSSRSNACLGVVGRVILWV